MHSEKVTMKVLRILVLAAALCTTVLSSCAPATAPIEPTSAPSAPTVAPTTAPEAVPSPTAVVEQKLVFAIPKGPTTIDPDHQHWQSMMIYRLLYDKLAETDETGTLRPSLAESWEIVDDVTWRFHLRQGVSFHNGEPFNADSVKFTIDFNLDPDNNRQALMARGVRGIAGVNVIDEYTVDIITEEPDALLVANLSIVDMLPPKYYAEVGSEGFNQAPIGTGMFKYVDWKVDEYIKLEANDDYWGGAPLLDSLEFRVIPEDSARMAALRAGEVDVASTVIPEMTETLEAEGFLVLPTVFGQSLTIMFGRMTVAEGTGRIEPLQDLRVRQAINYAIDRDAIVEYVTGGWARKLDGQLAPPEAFGYDPNIEAWPYDPEKARDLLAEAGYPDGFTVTLVGTQGSFFKDKEVFETLVAQLAEVGITAELELLEPAVWSEQVRAGTLGGGGLYHLSWNTIPSMDVAQTYPLWTSDHPRGYWGMSEEFDDLCAQQQQTVDPEERLPLLRRMAEIVNELAGMAFLYQQPVAYGVSPHVQGLVFRPDGSVDMSGVYIQ